MTAKTCFSAFTKRIVSDQFGSNFLFRIFYDELRLMSFM